MSIGSSIRNMAVNTAIRFKLFKQPSSGIKPAPEPGNKKKRASYSIKTNARKNTSYQIEDVKKAITAALNNVQPNRKNLTLIYYYIMQDSHLSCQIQIALQKVLAEPCALYDDKGNILEEETKLIQTNWFEQLLIWQLEEEFYGFRLVECIVNPDKTVEVALIPNENVCPEFQTIWLTEPFQQPSIVYADLKEEFDLMFFGNTTNFGLLQKAAYNVIWKFYSRNDWSRASEKFGMPILAVEADTNNDVELDRLEQKAANFGMDGFFISQSGDKVNIIERKGQDMHKIYLENINYCDEQISKLVNGQTGASDEKSFTGAAQVHERLMEDITFARMRKLRFSTNSNVIPFLKSKGLLSDKVKEFDFVRFKTPVVPVNENDIPAPEAKPNPADKKPLKKKR
jgi:hypothetical protein